MTACDVELAGVVCGSTDTVRRYLFGHRCRTHAPANPTPDPAATAEGLASRDAAWSARVEYGTAKTDPLGRLGWNKQTRLPSRSST